jgi:glycosyltransferase involved in cell wall biosynthesis
VHDNRDLSYKNIENWLFQMKILIITDLYPPFIGGSYRHAQTLSQGLAKRNNEVIVFTIGNTKQTVIENIFGVRIIRSEGFFQRVPFLFKDKQIKYSPPANDFLVCRLLERIIRLERPDVVHVHGWLLYSVLKLKKKLNFPLVVTLHDHGYICPMISFFKNNKVCTNPFTIGCVNCARAKLGLPKSLLISQFLKQQKKNLKLVDKFISVCSYTKEIYSKYLDLGSKITVIPNFFDMEKSEARLIKNEKYPDEFILFVGSLGPYKGVDVLLDAYSRLKTNTKLVLIGAKDPIYNYEGSGKVKIIENASHQVVMNAFSMCKFAVLPSTAPEPCPTAILEAMSCKKAVIASISGGIPEIVRHGKTGLLVPVNDSIALEKAMKSLLEDPDRALEMGQRGHERLVSTYSLEVNLSKIQQLYESLL